MNCLDFRSNRILDPEYDYEGKYHGIPVLYCHEIINKKVDDWIELKYSITKPLCWILTTYHVLKHCYLTGNLMPDEVDIKEFVMQDMIMSQEAINATVSKWENV
jgi:hypothetical protein